MTPIRLTTAIWFRSVGEIRSIITGSVKETYVSRKNRKMTHYVEVQTDYLRHVILCESAERGYEIVDDMEKQIKKALAEDFRSKAMGER